MYSEAILDATAVGVARFLNRVCGAGIKKIGALAVTAEIPINMDDL
jgi:hypothetical protein